MICSSENFDYRTGELDSLIEEFLNPPEKIDISQCVGCQGKGWIYPEGFDKGAKNACEKLGRRSN